MDIHLSFSKNYASGFVNTTVSLAEFAALQGCRLFHCYDDRMVRRYAQTFYSGNSQCYHWLCMLNYYNQFTGDLLSRKRLRPYLTFQYVFYDITPFKPLKQFLADIKDKPNIVCMCGDKAVRIFYILDKPYPLTQYACAYAHFLPVVAAHGIVTDCSTPKVIRADRGAVISEKYYAANFVTKLY